MQFFLVCKHDTVSLVSLGVEDKEGLARKCHSKLAFSGSEKKQEWPVNSAHIHVVNWKIIVMLEMYHTKIYSSTWKWTYNIPKKTLHTFNSSMWDSLRLDAISDIMCCNVKNALQGSCRILLAVVHKSTERSDSKPPMALICCIDYSVIKSSLLWAV